MHGFRLNLVHGFRLNFVHGFRLNFVHGFLLFVTTCDSTIVYFLFEFLRHVTARKMLPF